MADLQRRPVNAPLEKIPIQTRLTSRGVAEHAPDMWRLEGGRDRVQELANDLDQNTLSSLHVAVVNHPDGSQVTFLRAQPGRPLILSQKRATPLRSYAGMNNFYLPAGHKLAGAIRRDAVRDHLAADPSKLSLLIRDDNGQLVHESVPFSAFKPVPDILDYTAGKPSAISPVSIGDSSPFGLEAFVQNPKEKLRKPPKLKRPERADLNSISRNDLLRMYGKMWAEGRPDFSDGSSVMMTGNLPVHGYAGPRSSRFQIGTNYDENHNLVVQIFDPRGSEIHRIPYREALQNVQRLWRGYEDRQYQKELKEQADAWKAISQRTKKTAAPAEIAPEAPPTPQQAAPAPSQPRQPRTRQEQPQQPVEPLPEIGAGSPDADKQRLEEMRRQFLDTNAPLDSPEKQRYWPTLARMESRTGNQREAALSWTNAIWEQPQTPPAWAEAWARGEAAHLGINGRTPQDMLRAATAAPDSPAQARALASSLLWGATQNAKPADLRATQAKLEADEPYLSTRQAWLAHKALSEMSGGDTLGLARARDRIMQRLLDEKGLSSARDIPQFVMSGKGGDSAKMSEIRNHVGNLRNLIHKWIDVPGAAGKATHDYADMMLGFGLGRIGDHHDAARIAAPAVKSLAGTGDRAHALLSGVLQHRLGQILEGQPHGGELPQELQAAKTAIATPERTGDMGKYIVDRFLSDSSIAEPREKLDPFRNFRSELGDFQKQFQAIEATRNPAQVGQLITNLVSSQKTPEGTLRAIGSTVPLAPRAGEAFTTQLLERVPAVIDANTADTDPAAAEKASTLSSSLLLASHFNRPDIVGRLMQSVGNLVAQSSGQRLNDVIANVGSNLMSAMRKHGMADAAHAMLNSMEQKLTGGKTLQEVRAANPQSFSQTLVALLKVAEGRMALGDFAHALPTIDEARNVLFGTDLRKSVPAYMKLARSYVSSLAHAPVQQALPRIEELLSKMPSVPNSYSTASHYSRDHLSLVEDIVHALMGSEFSLNDQARRYADEDEYLVRRRINADMQNALNKESAPSRFKRVVSYKSEPLKPAATRFSRIPDGEYVHKDGKPYYAAFSMLSGHTHAPNLRFDSYGSTILHHEEYPSADHKYTSVWHKDGSGRGTDIEDSDLHSVPVPSSRIMHDGVRPLHPGDSGFGSMEAGRDITEGTRPKFERTIRDLAEATKPDNFQGVPGAEDIMSMRRHALEHDDLSTFAVLHDWLSERQGWHPAIEQAATRLGEILHGPNGVMRMRRSLHRFKIDDTQIVPSLAHDDKPFPLIHPEQSPAAPEPIKPAPVEYHQLPRTANGQIGLGQRLIRGNYLDWAVQQELSRRSVNVPKPWEHFVHSGMLAANRKSIPFPVHEAFAASLPPRSDRIDSNFARLHDKVLRNTGVPFHQTELLQSLLRMGLKGSNAAPEGSARFGRTGQPKRFASDPPRALTPHYEGMIGFNDRRIHWLLKGTKLAGAIHRQLRFGHPHDEASDIGRNALLDSTNPDGSINTVPVKVLADWMKEHPEHWLSKSFNWDNVGNKLDLDWNVYQKTHEAVHRVYPDSGAHAMYEPIPRLHPETKRPISPVRLAELRYNRAARIAELVRNDPKVHEELVKVLRTTPEELQASTERLYNSASRTHRLGIRGRHFDFAPSRYGPITADRAKAWDYMTPPKHDSDPERFRRIFGVRRYSHVDFHSDLLGFARHKIDNPYDDSNAAALADWLEERDDPLSEIARRSTEGEGRFNPEKKMLYVKSHKDYIPLVPEDRIWAGLPRRKIRVHVYGILPGKQKPKSINLRLEQRLKELSIPTMVRLAFGVRPSHLSGEAEYGAMFSKDEAEKFASLLHPTTRDEVLKVIHQGYSNIPLNQAEQFARRRSEFVRRLQEAKKHKFSSTQFDIEHASHSKIGGSLVDALRKMANAIPDSALTDDGRSKEFHITSKYGLHTEDAEAVRQLVQGFGSIFARLGKTSIFPANPQAPPDKQYDVVKIDVNSPGLKRLHDHLSAHLENTATHASYSPHITLAYVKPGLGSKYAGNDKLNGVTLYLKTLTFSDKLRNKTTMRVDGKKKVAEQPLRFSKKRSYLPGEIMEDGNIFEPKKEPADLGSYIANRFKHEYGEPTPEISGESGFLLPDGRSVPMGSGGVRHEDHRGAIPTHSAQVSWGWPKEATDSFKVSSRSLSLVELLKRAKTVRLIVSGDMLGAESYHGGFTRAQKQAIMSHVMTHRPEQVIIHIGEHGTELSGHEPWDVEEALEGRGLRKRYQRYGNLRRYRAPSPRRGFFGRLLDFVRGRQQPGAIPSSPPAPEPVQAPAAPEPTPQPQQSWEQRSPVTGYPSPQEAVTDAANAQDRRSWEPKYPEFAVSPELGLNDQPSSGGDTPWENAPSTSHVAGWKLAGGGFVRKFYAPSIGAPDKTSYVLSVRFKGKHGGVRSEYEYYFPDEETADNYLESFRAAAHPGYVVRSLINAGVPYKRKFWRDGAPRRYSRGIEQLATHFWEKGMLTDEQADHLVREGFVNARQLKGYAEKRGLPEVHLPAILSAGPLNYEHVRAFAAALEKHGQPHTSRLISDWIQFAQPRGRNPSVYYGRSPKSYMFDKWKGGGPHVLHVSFPIDDKRGVVFSFDTMDGAGKKAAVIHRNALLKEGFQPTEGSYERLISMLRKIPRKPKPEQMRRGSPRRFSREDHDAFARSIVEGASPLPYADFLQEGGHNFAADIIRKHAENPLVSKMVSKSRVLGRYPMRASDGAPIPDIAFIRGKPFASVWVGGWKKIAARLSPEDLAKAAMSGFAHAGDRDTWLHYAAERSGKLNIPDERNLVAEGTAMFPNATEENSGSTPQKHYWNVLYISRVWPEGTPVHDAAMAVLGGDKSALVDLDRLMRLHDFEEGASQDGHNFAKLARVHGIDPEKVPHRFSRGTPHRFAMDLSGSLPLFKSPQQKLRRKLAEQILHKLGIKGQAINALHDFAGRVQPSVLQRIEKAVDASRVIRAAAWFGQLGKQPGLLVFNHQPQGPDRLYSMRINGGGNDVQSRLDAAGIQQRILIPHTSMGGGFTVVMHDPGGNTIRDRVGKLAMATNSIVNEMPGHGEILAGADPGETRAAYRKETRRPEQMRRGVPRRMSEPLKEGLSPIESAAVDKMRDSASEYSGHIKKAIAGKGPTLLSRMHE